MNLQPTPIGSTSSPLEPRTEFVPHDLHNSRRVFMKADELIHPARMVVTNSHSLKQILIKKKNPSVTQIVRSFASIIEFNPTIEDSHLKQFRTISHEIKYHARGTWRHYIQQHPFRALKIYLEVQHALVSAIRSKGGASFAEATVKTVTGVFTGHKWCGYKGVSQLIAYARKNLRPSMVEAAILYAGLRMGGLTRDDIAQIFVRNFREIPPPSEHDLAG